MIFEVAAAALGSGVVVFATGLIEQPAVFRNNDLPGVLLGSAAQRLLYRHGISAGERIVVATEDGTYVRRAE